MKQKTKRQLEESYRNIKPYINDDEELKKLCECCECYCGNNHNYEDCKNNQCFKMFLAYHYLELFNSWYKAGGIMSEDRLSTLINNINRTITIELLNDKNSRRSDFSLELFEAKEMKKKLISAFAV